MYSKKIVITGGPSTGKTSVIEKLETLSYTCLPEVIRTMTLEKKESEEKVIFESNPIISVADPMAFNTSILNARIAQYNSVLKLVEDFVFFDRGIPDVLAYMDCFKQKYGSDFTAACANHPYDLVFLMPPWKEIHRTDNERFESFEESLLVHECLENTYRHLGYDVITIPQDSVSNRVEFILDRINPLK